RSCLAAKCRAVPCAGGAADDLARGAHRRGQAGPGAVLRVPPQPPGGGRQVARGDRARHPHPRAIPAVPRGGSLRSAAGRRVRARVPALVRGVSRPPGGGCPQALRRLRRGASSGRVRPGGVLAGRPAGGRGGGGRPRGAAVAEGPATGPTGAGDRPEAAPPPSEVAVEARREGASPARAPGKSGRSGKSRRHKRDRGPARASRPAPVAQRSSAGQANERSAGARAFQPPVIPDPRRQPLVLAVVVLVAVATLTMSFLL